MRNLLLILNVVLLVSLVVSCRSGNPKAKPEILTNNRHLVDCTRYDMLKDIKSDSNDIRRYLNNELMSHNDNITYK
jgi:hypothetical protein